MARLGEVLAKALITLLVVVLVGGVVAVCVAAIWFPVEALVNFEPQNLAWGSPAGPAVTEEEQYTDAVLNVIFLSGPAAVLLLFLAVLIIVGVRGAVRDRVSKR